MEGAGVDLPLLSRRYEPAVVLVTARHSGSHFALSVLERYYQRHAMTEDRCYDEGVDKPPLWFCHAENEQLPLIYRRMSESRHMVMTMRNPMDVARSWIKRRRPMGKDFRDMWHNLFWLQGRYEALWLPVDTDDRQQRLDTIAKTLGVPLETDWEPRGSYADENPWFDGMTLEQAKDFFTTLPFEQFGYDYG